jgi:uncharacterized membrane protein YphA (DoxX/SURF4 family)
MLIALWILNSILALAFLVFGFTKLANSRPVLATKGMGWVDDFSGGGVKTIAILEIVGAAGLIVPLFTGIATVLAPIAATGLATIMIGAAVVHLRRSEPPIPSIPLAVLAAASAVLGFLAL